MNSEMDLPTVWKGVIDDQTLNQLFEDLQNHAEVLDVQVKQSATSYGNTSKFAPDECKLKLKSGEVKSIQIKYRYDHCTWCDTLLHQVDCIQLVRCKLE